jgi:hypothetical protein
MTELFVWEPEAEAGLKKKPRHPSQPEAAGSLLLTHAIACDYLDLSFKRPEKERDSVLLLGTLIREPEAYY